MSQSATTAASTPLKRRRALGTVLAMLAALACVEVVLRVLDLPRPERAALELYGGEVGDKSTFVDDPDLFYRLNPAASHWLPNAIGLRGALPAREKPDSELRIACVGASVTAGHYVQYHEAFGNVLARELQARIPGGAVTTILGGLPGYTTFQDVRLWRREIEPLRPDITILYCGTWNDLLPAMGCPDHEYAEQLARRSAAPRVLQVFARFVDRVTPRRLSKEAFERAFYHGSAPNGRRVPKEKFRENLELLVAGARQIGSTVILVVPARTDKVVRDVPIMLEYHQIVREVARAQDARLIDASQSVAAFNAALPADTRALPNGEGPCFVDGVHLLARGQRVIADELLRNLLADPPAKLRTLLDRPASAPAFTMSSVEPDHVECWHACDVTIHGEGFAKLARSDRFFLGDQWIGAWGRLDDERLVVTLPFAMRPGRARLVAITASGPVPGPELTMMPCRLRATPIPGDALALALEVDAHPNAHVRVAFAPQLQDPPVQTQWGEWHLLGRAPGRPPERADLPFSLAKLTLAGLDARTDERGHWRGRFELPREGELASAKQVHVQGVAWLWRENALGFATDLVTVPLAR